MGKRLLLRFLIVLGIGVCCLGIFSLVASFEGIVRYWSGEYLTGDHSLYVGLAPFLTFLIPLGALIFTIFRLYEALERKVEE